MTERQFSEVERALLAVGDAGARARRAAHAVRRDNAEPHVVEALHAAERELGHVYRALMQRTYYAVTPDDRDLPGRKTLQNADPSER